MDIRSTIRDIPDFPQPGVLFRDITPMLSSADALKAVVDRMTLLFRDERIEKVVGIESRGFMFGAPVAIRLGAGFVPVRKAGKLPAETVSQDYELEYGTATLEMHRDALHAEERVLIVDDVVATGGTLAAAVALVGKVNARVIACTSVIELLALKGRERIPGVRFESLVQY